MPEIPASAHDRIISITFDWGTPYSARQTRVVERRVAPGGQVLAGQRAGKPLVVNPETVLRWRGIAFQTCCLELAFWQWMCVPPLLMQSSRAFAIT